MAQNSSRLQRLLTLLDTGSTQATRLAAARQIGEIARSHPQDLNPLLKKVSQYLRSKSWDTRVAAAQAIGSIAENVKHTTLKELLELVQTEALNAGISDISKEFESIWSKFGSEIPTGLTFKSFQISKVLEFGSPLVASGGQEYDVANDNRSPAERLARQKQNLRRRLGLDMCEQFMDVSDVIKDEDLMAPPPPRGYNFQSGLIINGNQNPASQNPASQNPASQNPGFPNPASQNPGFQNPGFQNPGFQNQGNQSWVHPQQPGRNIQQLVSSMMPAGARAKRLSARELNMLKRKAKSSAKDHTKSEEGKPMSQGKNVPVEDPVGTSKEAMEAEEESSECEERGRWPFQHFVEQLIHDIFDPVWEVRHGAMMALREIITHQGPSARVFLPDLNSDSISFPDFDDDKSNPDLKKSQSFDLNKQLGCAQELEQPEPKRLKVSDESNGISDRSDPSVVSVKMETDLEGQNDENIGENVNLTNVEETQSELKPGLNINENSKLMKLMKVYQYSCLKNWEFLQDCAVRFLCVLSLDRFGDYVSDQVVAPVRETCAQALGAVLKYMHPSLVNETLNVLLQMQSRQEWEVRHGSLLGIKYLVAVRKELMGDLLVYVLPACKAGLGDPDDDVRAVAADALIPTAASLVSLDDQMLNSILLLLWDILLDLDDLSPSTSSVMNLLAEIYSQQEMEPKMVAGLISAEKNEVKNEVDLNGFELEESSCSSPYALAVLIPRLWPFMRHTITSVRNSAICTLERLLGVNKGSSDGSEGSKFWASSILGDAMRIVFQNLFLESNDSILQSSERVWRILLQCPETELESASSLYFASWVQLATTPYGSALDPSKMLWPVTLPRKSVSKAVAKMRASTSTSSVTILDFSRGQQVNVPQLQPAPVPSVERDGPTAGGKIVVGTDSEKSVTRTRVLVSTALGALAAKLPQNSWQVVVDPLWRDLVSLSGVQRQVASMILATWFKELRKRDASISQTLVVSLSQIKQWLLDLLSCSDPALPTKNSPLPYSELSRTYGKMRNEAKNLFVSVKNTGAFDEYLSSLNLNLDNLSVDESIEFGSKLVVPSEFQELESAKQLLLSTSGYLKCVQNNLHVAVSALLASAIVWTGELPSKLNPVILPLMAAIKREQEEILQDKAAEALAELILTCVGRKPGPNDKLLKNICTLTCADQNETPQASVITSMEVIEEQNLLSFNTRSFSARSARHHNASEDRAKLEGFISRRGAEMGLKHLCEKFGPGLFAKLPKVWDCLTEFLVPVRNEDPISKDELLVVKLSRSCEAKDPQSLINNIQVVRSVASLVEESLRPQVLSLLPCILGCVRHSHTAVRLAASRCVSSMAKSITQSVMKSIIETVIPMLSDHSSVPARQGAGILVSLLVQGLGVELVPYSPLLVVPLLRCMSDSDKSVRQSVTHSFAALVPLLPLAKGVELPAGLGEKLASNADDARFLEQLLDNSHIEDYKLAVELKVGLRRYQQEGINWLAFLRRFKLHGILCDDMGLGKTLQASAILASEIAENRAINKEGERERDSLSIIVCPSTLVAHWAYEIEKHISSSIMNTIQYVGSAPERTALQSQFDTCNVVITSYDIIRKDIEFLGKIVWNYCILDEGHIIKSSRSKITTAVKMLKSKHRLILSGTPIQNNVLELWSLFDFLMPGFLGTEKQFQSTYGKPLLAAKDSKCSAKDAEAGVLAMEALHKQVMPFLLRRTKAEVLSDLPEKIIQDRYCDLSPLQLKLYDQFSSSDAKEEVSTIVKSHEQTENPSAPKATTHVFQALQYLLKLCSHPLLVTGNKGQDLMESIVLQVVPGCRDVARELHELHHSPKLVALQEILEECGIGLDNSSSPDGSTNSAGQHRVLIFAQHKAFLDIIEKDLFHSRMRSVTYLRLDGSVQSEKRFEIVKAFNSDPTIDVLLLTTHVGGLGLNLTSADTLVFMEHDWNPMRDLQAMDRAHRLGQRRVVNVHRLIMRGTLEEKVMSLQKFKVSVANAVINAENASLKTMNTDQLLDLFASTPASRKGALLSSGSNNDSEKGSKQKGSGKGLKSILNGLDELWDHSQYTDEYDMSQFLSKLNG